MTLHPRDDVDRLYVSRKEGGIGLTSIEGSIEKLGEGVITATRNRTDDTKTNRTTMWPYVKRT